MVRRVTIAALSSVALIVLGVWFLLKPAPEHSTMIEIVAGALVSIIITLWFEAVRKPELVLELYHPGDPDSFVMKGPQGTRSGVPLQIDLINLPLPRSLAWFLQRDIATHCRGTIIFRYLDGSLAVERPMTARWNNSPQPIHKQHVVEQGETYDRIIYDLGRLITTRDVSPGCRDKLDVAVRLERDVCAYGWSNDTYWHGYYRVPWKLPQGDYLVEVRIAASNAHHQDVFRLKNKGELPEGFQLLPATASDRKIVREAQH